MRSYLKLGALALTFIIVPLLPNDVFIIFLKAVTFILGIYASYITYKLFEIERAISDINKLRKKLETETSSDVT